MTYRAISRDLPLGVAGDAEAHPVHVVDLEDLGHPLHLTVAGAAGVGSQRLDVSLVREMRVPWEVVDPHPFDRLLLGPGLPHLLDLRLVGAVPAADHQMTSHAGLHRRDAGLGGDLDRVMAVLALDLVLPGVNVVTEEDRLAGTLEAAAVRGGDDRSPGAVGSCSSL